MLRKLIGHPVTGIAVITLGVLLAIGTACSDGMMFKTHRELKLKGLKREVRFRIPKEYFSALDEMVGIEAHSRLIPLKIRPRRLPVLPKYLNVSSPTVSLTLHGNQYLVDDERSRELNRVLYRKVESQFEHLKHYQYKTSSMADIFLGKLEGDRVVRVRCYKSCSLLTAYDDNFSYKLSTSRLALSNLDEIDESLRKFIAEMIDEP